MARGPAREVEWSAGGPPGERGAQLKATPRSPRALTRHTAPPRASGSWAPTLGVPTAKPAHTSSSEYFLIDAHQKFSVVLF